MIAGLVLAAGASRRMGSPKLLLPWEGTTILGSVVEALTLAALDPILVVVGEERAAIAEALRGSTATLVDNPNPATGEMLQSIQIGLMAMPDAVEAAAIMPGDLPKVKPETVGALIAERKRGSKGIVAPVHAGRRGHPILLPREVWSEVLALGPEASLRSFLRGRAATITAVEVQDPGVHRDVDTPEEYVETREYGD